MATSDVLADLVDLVSQVEEKGGNVREISIAESKELTGTVRIGLPAFEATTDEVRFDVLEAEFNEGVVDLAVEVSIPPTDQRSPPEQRTSVIDDPDRTETGSQPVYKDPTELKKVYEEFDTFPEMTEALGVDVTPETVRRYMVEYEIHDPVATNRTSELLAAGKSAVQTPVTEESDTENASTDDGLVEAKTDGGVVESDTTSSFETQSVAELLARKSSSDETPLVADGSGIPKSLTVAELADILERSRTITEAQRSLDLDYEQTRRLLRKLGLLEFVTGRLAASHSKVPPELVTQHLENYSDSGCAT
ncbi:hypothetical protein [Natronococcus sp. A-GB7]|uniref:hypothetical protein n=1 Tax=Natronococcus sp. A-GB7 TaxID=3037649 RepID=UPI00241DD7E5|nr:hypothetical protein [Natronococcus sp. A-GB7]MDG5821402.1 hypothetical protein [Natronococcus sp. A-GB7]